MRIERLLINNIPSLCWGEPSDKLFIAIHGNMSSKEDEVIKRFAHVLVMRGYQLISFDLPEHGERQNDLNYLCKPQNCIDDLQQVMNYAKTVAKEISVFACSIGAYFSLLAYPNEKIKQCLFLSPIVDMKSLIDNMMLWNNTTEKELRDKKEIKTDFNQILYWDYYTYVKNHPIVRWDKKTAVLYGSKDNLQSKTLIKEFSQKFNCKLNILEGGEHFFHTQEQLQCYQDWIYETLKG
ncbi:esterase/lipase [Breznakia sp. PF5-3]|uniref:alpha/beta hydrolase n=1 Tax=unclassified Breznakia TaxID=2623764 RepID=UPI0024058666|nr:MULTISPECIES: alpha/beta hydrolase [unclassified Breznakia]MDF9825654.1 alpha-beta hydrolase superfamily lysophospholipase [Breznakia sp. PM6-1]MDF9836506.1 esterase/lipase [Breznakia sp. PF5-3]MDF9838651.1 alpha-beta hydrolase superfamily lysophospholipase [Breznakia sp. PFB2-8]MDF9860682.1 alpha-beta hydrolase superfamily lysophospholipase [Breznakia sp. PH5-24]